MIPGSLEIVSDISKCLSKSWPCSASLEGQTNTEIRRWVTAKKVGRTKTVWCKGHPEGFLVQKALAHHVSSAWHAFIIDWSPCDKTGALVGIRTGASVGRPRGGLTLWSPQVPSSFVETKVQRLLSKVSFPSEYSLLLKQVAVFLQLRLTFTHSSHAPRKNVMLCNSDRSRVLLCKFSFWFEFA